MNQFLAAARMTADAPDRVAHKILAAIVAKDVVIGAAEQFYGRLNAIPPRVVDAGVSGQAVKTRRLLETLRQGEME